jgi:4-hydroxy-tetrahydrodipicolinate synthase
MELQGIIPPLVTPMKANEDVDFERLKLLIDFQLSRGVHGIFVLGTTGEFYSLSESEKQEIMAVTVAHVNKRVPVFAGTGAETTREVIHLTKIAENEGIDGVSIITPYFIAPNQSEIAAHFRKIAENTSLPIILYSNPQMGSFLKIEPETVARLAELPNVIGIKDSSGDLSNFIEIVRLTPPKFGVLIGRDTLIYSSLQVGGKGAVPATCNIAPDLAVGIYEQFQKGDLQASWHFQQRLSPVRLAMSLGTPPGSIKVAMSLLGQHVGPSRAPVAPMPPERQEQLRSILKNSGLLGN